jgi:hypothetical protein
MGNPLQKIGEWLVKAMTDKLVEPITAMQQQVTELSATVESKHASDPAALECDLSLLDDRICCLIDKARERGYTTAGERRRVSRMHDAYRARGGNHGEEQEYERYCCLPTEEEWRRLHQQE